MKYQELTGLFTKTIVSKKEGVKDRIETVAEVTYEYSKKNGHPIPAMTLAIVPFRSAPGAALELGIGWTWCSDKDNARKSKGRSIARARAIGAIQNMKSTHITLRSGREVGFTCMANTVNEGMFKDGNIGVGGVLNADTVHRIIKTVEHLVQQANS